MNTIRAQNIDCASKGGGDRGNKNCEASIVKLFDNKRGNEGFLDLGQGRPPRLAFTLTCQPLSKTSQEWIAGDSLEQRLLDLSPECVPNPGADYKTCEVADN